MNSFFAVDKIYLMLGTACNLKCRHCYQTDVPQPHLKKTVNPEVVAFLRNLADARPDPIELVFWGGEPLLYRSLMRVLVDTLGSGFVYNFITNGTLLTDDDVDWANAHNVLVGVSCDGAFTDRVRGVNILEDADFCRRFKRIRRHCIGTTVHAYNIDPMALEKYVRERVGETNIHYQYTLECTWPMDRDLYAYNFHRYKQNLAACRRQFLSDVLEGKSRSIAIDCLRRGVAGVMSAQRRRDRGEPERWWPECSPMRKTMNIDIQGNVHLCHNRTSVVGRVTDDYNTLLEASDRMLKAALAGKTECDSCAVVRWCRRGCPLNNAAVNPGQRICCEAERIYWIESLLTVEDAAHITSEIDL